MSAIKNCIIKTLLALGPKNIPASAILLYHNVGRDGAYLTTTPENFSGQMEFLRANYHIISLHDLVDNLRHGHPILPRTAVLTFDDGFAGQYDFVFPILRASHLPATFFVATGIVGKSLRLSSGHDLPIMGWEQIWEIGSVPHLEIAPHSVTHREFTRLPPDEARREVRESSSAIAEKIGRTSKRFAYPRGKFSAESVIILKEEGMEAAVTVRQGLVAAGDDPFLLCRNTIDSSVTDLKLFEARLGWPIKILSHLL